MRYDGVRSLPPPNLQRAEQKQLAVLGNALAVPSGFRIQSAHCGPEPKTKKRKKSWAV